MLNLIAFVVVFVSMTILALGRPVYIQQTPKTTLATYDFVPDFVDCEDISLPHSNRCSLEEAILDSDMDGISTANRICELLK